MYERSKLISEKAGAMMQEHAAMGLRVGMDTPQRSREIPDLLSRLRNILSEVHIELTELNGQLIPVMRGATPTSSTAGIKESSPSTECGSALFELIAQAEGLRSQVFDMRGRLEI